MVSPHHRAAGCARPPRCRRPRSPSGWRRCRVRRGPCWPAPPCTRSSDCLEVLGRDGMRRWWWTRRCTRSGGGRCSGLLVSARRSCRSPTRTRRDLTGALRAAAPPRAAAGAGRGRRVRRLRTAVSAAGRGRRGCGAHGGVLLLDDTQALGVYGDPAGGDHPFGRGGGGSLRRAGVGFDGVVSVASLAKAFGAPVTSIAGDAALVARIGRLGGSAMHSSPPSAVDTAAAARALDRNAAARRPAAAPARDQDPHAAPARAPARPAPGRRAVPGAGAPRTLAVPAGRRLLRRLAAGGVRAVLRRDCARRQRRRPGR